MPPNAWATPRCDRGSNPTLQNAERDRPATALPPVYGSGAGVTASIPSSGAIVGQLSDAHSRA